MEGYRPEPTVYSLNFDDTVYKGMKVKIRSCTVGEWNMLLGFLGAQGVEAINDANNGLFELFLKKLKEWNLLDPDSGEPVAMTQEGFESVEQPVIAAILTAWQIAMVAVPAPLQNASPNGSSSQEASLGMVVKSPSPPSWPTQS